MSRPPIPPLAPMPPRPGRFRQTPPAIFTPVFGLLGLGLAWRRGAEAFGVLPGLAELILGAATLLYLFCALAYLAKIARRASVVHEDLRALPGRAGLTAASLSIFLLAATATPYAPGLALALLFAGLAIHTGLTLLYIRALWTAPPEGRKPTPIWHLTFVGFIIAPLAAVPLGLTGLSMAIVVLTIPVAIAIWAVSLVQFLRDGMPPPLRPLMAIHLSPAALFTSVTTSLGLDTLAAAFALLTLAIFALLFGLVRWLTVAGFSPLWGAFTFPTAAAASAVLALGGEPMRSLGGAILIAATLVIPPIVVRVMKLWAGGSLGPKTNAAIA